MAPYDPFLQWLDSRKSEMSSLVEKWANINSHSLNLVGLQEQLSELKKSYRELHGDLQELELPPHIRVDDRGSKSHVHVGRALHISKRTSAPLKIFFSGHMDTVYGINSPFQKAVYLDHNRLNGPGVLDMKGGLVILLYALLAFEKSPWANALGWEILITPDEEIGSPSSKELIIRASERNHFGFVFEPALADGSFVSHRAGSKGIVILVHGKMAHSGRAFREGRSAAFAAADLIVQLEKLNTVNEDVIVNVGVVHSGTGANVVPDLAVIRISLRAQTTALMEEAYKRICDIARNIESRDGITTEVIEETGRPPKEKTGDTEKMLKWIESCSRELNLPFSTGHSKGVTDGNIMAQAGLANIDSLGARGGKIHSPEEYLEIDSLLERSKLLALLLMKLAAGDFVDGQSKNAPDSVIRL